MPTFARCWKRRPTHRCGDRVHPGSHPCPAAAMAIRLGKHVYCQKPLTHSVFEARVLTDLARKHKVATQMGNQGHSNPDSRRYVELIQAGVLGDVKEVHIWTDRPIWPQGIGRPAGSPPVPKGLDWDLWLGPAQERPYHPAYHPFKWRGFWDFGTGAVGDMGCHNSDLAYWALDLRNPKTLEAKSSDNNPETAPKWSIITYYFPQQGKRKPVKVVWYDGGKTGSRPCRAKVATRQRLHSHRQQGLTHSDVLGQGDISLGSNRGGSQGCTEKLRNQRTSIGTTTSSGSMPARRPAGLVEF